MARIRTIKPEFWTNERLSALPEASHLLAAALLNYSDDEGFFNANVALVKSACSPLREPSTSIPESLGMLNQIGYLRFFDSADGRRYGQIVGFTNHQTINRASPSKIRPLLALPDNSVIVQGGVSDHSRQEWNGTGNREQGMVQGGDDTAGTADANGSEDGKQATSKATGGDYPESFEALWEAYPARGGRKRGKCKCFGIWRQAIRTAERQSLVEAARNYAASDDATRGFAKDPERFLAKDWWRDWVPAIVPQPRAPPPKAPPEVPHHIPKARFNA